MTRPLVATKLFLPRLRRDLVARPRLLERLEDGADARLTLVSAPAGFGKTTVLATWLHQGSTAGRGVAWLSLDPADNDPTSFWTYVLTAFQRAAPGVGSRALELLTSTPGATEPVLTSLLNDLAASPAEVWLVLDDYHVIDDPAVGQTMAFLLDHLPAQAHVVLSTRADPDLPVARWRAGGELVEIRAADLRFTPDEAGTYLRTATDAALTPDDVAALEERTEGWIAALQLAALSLQGRQDARGFVSRFAGDDRYVVDYLVEEVLRHQPDAERAFLLHSAVLDRLTGPLCDAVTGRTDGSVMLVALERANLFLVPLDDRREWYRYHHLFADVLRARLLSEHPQQVPVLHQRASEWYERHQLREEAVRHALAARDFDRAADLVELAVSAVRRDRQEPLMYGWLRALPDETIRSRPVLSVCYGAMLLHAGDLDAVGPRLDHAERGLAAVSGGAAPHWPATDELRALPATIEIYRASLAQALGDAVATAGHARRALDLAGPDDHLARGGAAGFLALAAWARGDVSTALETFSLAVASLHAAGNLIDELSSTVVLSDLWVASGRPATARRLCEQALRRAETSGEDVARATADLHVALSEIDLDAGDLAGARRHLEAAVAPGERAGPNEGSYRWFVASGRVAHAAGEPAEAIRLLDQAEQLYRPGFFPDVRPIAAVRARVWIAEGQLAEAADWARDRKRSGPSDADYLSEYDDLTLVRLLLAQHRQQPGGDALGRATELLTVLQERAEAFDRAGSLQEIHLLRALADEARGGSGPQRRPAEVLAPRSGPAESLSERELQVLRLLDTELTGPEIARQLFVSHNTMRTHTKHIFTKLDVGTRRAAVLRARQLGLL